MPARTKKAAATPGTGAGVKKRASTSKRATNAAPGSRSRKAKSQAVIKMEEQEHDDTEDDEMIDLTTPTKKGGSNQVMAGLGGGTGSGATNYILPTEFTDFPAILPDMVLERQAILVNNNGIWTITLATIDIHTQWLARLPARIQSQFYTQASSASSNDNGGNDNGGKNNNSGTGANNFILEEEDEATAQLIREHFDVIGAANIDLLAGTLPMLPLDMDFMNVGYLAPVANDHGSNNVDAPDQAGEFDPFGNIDLHSIPMHPSYLQQLDGEAREQEARDSDALFGSLDGFYGDC